MPKIIVCQECMGKGKVKAATPPGAAQDATIFLRCRTCNGVGWVITPEVDDSDRERKQKLDVRKELEDIESNPFTRDDVISYLQLMIRLLDERLPSTSEKEKKQPATKKRARASK